MIANGGQPKPPYQEVGVLPDCVNDGISNFMNMNNIKSLGIIALGALSFTFMSFSGNSDDMYTASYSSNIKNLNAERIEQAVFPTIITAALAKVAAAAATSKKAAAAAAAVTVTAAATGATAELGRTAAVTIMYANHVEEHSRNYAKAIEDLKDQQMRKLG